MRENGERSHQRSGGGGSSNHNSDRRHATGTASTAQSFADLKVRHQC